MYHSLSQVLKFMWATKLDASEIVRFKIFCENQTNSETFYLLYFLFKSPVVHVLAEIMLKTFVMLTAIR